MSYQDLDLSSPWMNAAGMCGFSPPARWPWPEPPGCWVTNPLSLARRTPAESRGALTFPGGLLLHSGLPDPGLKSILRNHASAWGRSSLPAWVHLIARTPDEIHRMALMLEGVEGVAALEIGISDEQDRPGALAFLEAALGELPVAAAVPLNRCAEPWLDELKGLGVIGLTLCGPRGMLPGANGKLITGRLYGPALFPQVLAAVKTALRLDLPLTAGAGVFSLEHGQALLQAGASAVQLDTVLWL